MKNIIYGIYKNSNWDIYHGEISLLLNNKIVLRLKNFNIFGFTEKSNF